VTPGKYGENVFDIPVYDTVKEALENHEIDAAGIFVPGRFAKDAAFEAIDAGIKLLVVLTEGIPMHDSVKIKTFARKRNEGHRTQLSRYRHSRQCSLGLMDTHHVMPGNIGVISRSGTLTTEITASMNKEGVGQSTIVGIGGDGVIGSTIKDIFGPF